MRVIIRKLDSGLVVLDDDDVFSRVYDTFSPEAMKSPNDFSGYPNRVLLRDLTRLTQRQVAFLMYRIPNLQFVPPLKVRRPSGLTCGGWDIIQPGHPYLLLAAASLLGEGDLIALVRSDKMYEKQKGKKPIIDEKDRARIICGYDGVKAAIIMNTDREDSYRFIEGLFVEGYPDAYFFGYDQLNSNQPSGWNLGLMTYLPRTKFYQITKHWGLSSTVIKNSISQNH